MAASKEELGHTDEGIVAFLLLCIAKGEHSRLTLSKLCVPTGDGGAGGLVRSFIAML